MVRFGAAGPVAAFSRHSYDFYRISPGFPSYLLGGNKIGDPHVTMVVSICSILLLQYSIIWANDLNMIRGTLMTQEASICGCSFEEYIYMESFSFIDVHRDTHQSRTVLGDLHVPMFDHFWIPERWPVARAFRLFLQTAAVQSHWRQHVTERTMWITLDQRVM